MSSAWVGAEPSPIAIDPRATALVIIDMQRDFLEPGGFGEALGNDVSLLHMAIEPCHAVLAAARREACSSIHTREGHRPDLTDAPPAKIERGRPSLRIGDPGPMGRILVAASPATTSSPRWHPIGGRAGRRQAGQGRLLRHRPRRDPAQSRASTR